MSPFRRRFVGFLRSPWSGAGTGTVSGLLGGLSWAGLTPSGDRESDRLAWLSVWFAFTFFGFLWSFIAQQLRISDLEGAAKPYLSLVFGRGEQLYDSLHHEGGLRILRVGVRNSGASVQDVAVKVTRIEPSLPRVFPMQELQRTHAADGVARFTVNKSDEPLVFVDVIHQRIFT